MIESEGGVAYVHSWAGLRLTGSQKTWQCFGAGGDDRIIPSGYRRRLGTFARMAVASGLSLRNLDESDIVFCSRYGDMEVACKLLLELAVGGTLSPAGFSMSVHNAAPGVIDLIRKSNVGHTAIAAGTQSLSAGIVEAWSRLQASPERRVALVYAETRLPNDREFRSEDEVTGRALALEISLRDGPTASARLVLDRSAAVEDRLERPHSEGLCDRLVKILDGEEKAACRWHAQGLNWSFGARDDA